jgi:NAD(P)-dependent dehydrogenase (short-subunit alcohol dehydrogenase family)
MQQAGQRFQDKVVIVTGSGGGIGLEVAKHFAKEGAKIVTNGRSLEHAVAAAEEIRAAGGDASAVEADVRTWAGARQLVDGANKAFGGVDVLVNNAGISMIARADELDPEEWERAIATNLSGPYFCSRAVFSSMKARGGGVIVNIGSVTAHLGFPLRVAYCTAKHGLVGLTKVLALDWVDDGIRVLQVDPARRWRPGHRGLRRRRHRRSHADAPLWHRGGGRPDRSPGRERRGKLYDGIVSVSRRRVGGARLPVMK